MNNSKINEETKKSIVADYTKGISINELIKKYHHKFNVISKILDEYNVKHSYSESKLMKQPKVILTQEQKDTIIDLYVNKQKGLMYCIKAVGHNDLHLVRQVLKEAGVQIRNFSEAASVSNVNRRVYSINDEYFKIETSNMAYLLGLYAADGTVRKDNNGIKITLSSVDKDFLDTVAKELQYEKGTKTFVNSQGFECTSLEFASKEIKEDFAKYNIIPAKTYTYVFPVNLNKKYWIDFIRGYFDGDGSVSTSGPKAIKWQICSATPDVLQHVVDFLYEEYAIPKVEVYFDKNHGKQGLYNICYSTNSTKKIYEILYTPGSLYLPRKKEKFINLLNKNANDINLQETAIPQREE